MKRISKASLAVILALSVTLYGCANIGAYINLGATMALDILQIIAAFKGATVPAGDISFVQTVQQQAAKDWTDIQNAYTQFSAAKTPGTINALTAALSVANTDLSTFEQDLHIANPDLKNKISAALLAMLSTVQTIAAFANVQVAAPASIRAKLGPQKKLSLNDLKKQWNGEAANGIPSAQIQ